MSGWSGTESAMAKTGCYKAAESVTQPCRTEKNSLKQHNTERRKTGWYSRSRAGFELQAPLQISTGPCPIVVTIIGITIFIIYILLVHCSHHYAFLDALSISFTHIGEWLGNIFETALIKAFYCYRLLQHCQHCQHWQHWQHWQYCQHCQHCQHY